MVITSYYNITSRLKEAWLTFEQQDGVSPFMYYGYLKNVFNHRRLLGIFRGILPVIKCVEDTNGAILAIAPLVYNIFSKKYRMLGDIRGCGKADFLYKCGLSWQECVTCCNLILNGLGEKFYLHRVPGESVLEACLKERNLSVEQKDSCDIKIADDYNMWFSNLSSSVRQNIRTAYNRMKRDQCDFNVIIMGNEKSFDSKLTPISRKIYRECLDMYVNRQLTKYHNKGVRIKRIMRGLRYKYIKFDSTSLYSDSNAILVALQINGTLAAYMGAFSSYDGKSVVVPRLAIDERFKFYSPGYLMLCEVIKFLTENTDVESLDLSRGLEKYKMDLGAVPYKCFNFSRK